MRILPTILYASAHCLALCAVPAAAQLPTPPMSSAPSQAQSYLFYGGAGDVFEITSSMIALQKSQNPQLRAFASMLIDHHTRLTNGALDTAKSAGVMAPPPELSTEQKAMIRQLIAASPATFDRTFIDQQIMAHQQALTLQSGYASGGDVPALRQAAQGAIPTVQEHLAQAQQMRGLLR